MCQPRLMPEWSQTEQAISLKMVARLVLTDPVPWNSQTLLHRAPESL